MLPANTKSRIDFFSTFLITCIIYRLWLLPSYFYLFLGLVNDLLLGAIFFTILFVIQFMVSFVTRYHRLLQFIYSVCESIVLYGVLFFIAVIYMIHKKLIGVLATGLTYAILMNALQQGFSLRDYAPFLTFGDYLFLITPIVIFSLLKFTPFQRMESLQNYIPATGFPRMILIVFFYLFIFPRTLLLEKLNVQTYLNPMIYLIQDVFHSVDDTDILMGKNLPSMRQMHSVAFVDPIFTDQAKLAPAVRVKHDKPSWNIVLIILESVGSAHLFDVSSGNRMPMPFLHQLAQKSWWLNNNYSSGNASIAGSFGIMSGIYPSPSVHSFTRRSDIVIPNFAEWLGNQYDSFFVGAWKSHFFFPEAFFKHAGFKNFYDKNNIPEKVKSPFSVFLNEEDGVTFFLSRLQKAKPPFFATYWSGVDHFPYDDYGRAYRIMPHIDSNLDRYINNLNLLDRQIKRIYALLQNKKWLDHTIIIVVGDHGEAFGEHPGTGDWMHGQTLFSEQTKVPLLIYQPKLFKPQQIDKVTSSVDILPTILDAIHLPYHSNLMQGESLLKPVLSRKYIFIYGEENEIAAITQNNKKMQISFSGEGCKSYNLNIDPQERQPLDCVDTEQKNAILKYRNYQSAMLMWYNSALKS